MSEIQRGSVLDRPIGVAKSGHSAHLDERRRQSAPHMVDPLFLLAPPRSFTSVTCAMLGLHPQMYGLLETSLFCAETVAEWWGLCEHAPFPMSHGLLRTVAQLVFGAQTETNVQEAGAWLRRRAHWTTGFLFEFLAVRVAPRMLVEKSPSIVYQIGSMQRANEMFPHARYVHLVRHPIGHAESVMKHLRIEGERKAPPEWLLNLAAWPGEQRTASQDSRALDPQHSWLSLNRNIREFLAKIARERQRRVRAEDFLAHPDRTLRDLLDWLGLRSDQFVIDEMKQTEKWPYASIGPRNAPFGTDKFFLERPELRPERVRTLTLDEPVSWLPRGQTLHPEVRELAQEFGYH
jgi:Sulfotransferase family